MVLVRWCATPQVAGTLESFTVSGLDTGTTYFFSIRTADEVSHTGQMPKGKGLSIGKSEYLGCINAEKNWG